jgi:TolA-binding protein
MRRFLGAGVLAMALLVGCSASDSGNSESSNGASDSGGGESAPGQPAGAPVTGEPERQVVTTATASLEVENPARGAQRISELVESAGGRVDERTEQAGSAKHDGYADLVVRVPADALTGVLADLDDLGDVETVSVSHSDVTSTAVDLDARISALRTSVARLQALMDDAGSIEDLLDAEKALSDRQGQLESLQSQRALLADQVDLSTLSVHLRPFGVAPAGGPDSFTDGLGTGWKALVSVLNASVVALGILLPWLALAALVAAAVLVLIRIMRRRRLALEAAAAAPPQG